MRSSGAVVWTLRDQLHVIHDEDQQHLLVLSDDPSSLSGASPATVRSRLPPLRH